MASVLDLVKHYQHNIEKYPQDEQKILKSIDKLFRLDVKVQHLQDTGVGRTVNALRKEPGHVGQAARALVYKWKQMVAAEESDQEGDHNESSIHNGYGSGKDSESNINQPKNRENHYEKSNSTPKSDQRDHKQVNGEKRKYQSSEEEETYVKKSKHSSSSERDDSRTKLVHPKSEPSETESHDSGGSQSEDSDSEMSESSEEEKPPVKIKTEPVEKFKSPENSSHSNHNELKKESSSSKRSHDSTEKHSKRHSSESRHSEKSSSKEKSHSSHKEKISKEKDSSSEKAPKEKDSSSEKKHKSDHKSSSSNKEKSHKEPKPSSTHSSDKHKSSSQKPDSGSEKHKSHSEKSKSEKHSSSSSNKPEKEKHKSSSEKEIPNEKQKSKDSSSSSKDKSSSRKEKSKDRSSSSKERSSSHKSDKKQSSSSDKSKSSDSKNRVEKSEERSNEKKSSHKSSSSHKSKSSSSKSKEVPKNKPEGHSGDSDDDGIDCESGASFAEVLGMMAPPKAKKKSTPLKDANSPNISYDMSPAALLAPTAKLAPLPTLEISALPEISPNYKPRPPPKFLPHFSDEDAMSQVISSKNLRTKVYSGNKIIGKIPTLYEMCVQVLQEHIDALEYTGGVPYEILKPVVDKATPQQLFMLEHYNAYLMEDTDHLWQKHCEKHFRNKKREEMETWREMFIRCQEEQEYRLKSLTANIRMTQEAKKAPIKQTKMAYVDSVVKPPRNIARKQALHGTAHTASASPAARVAALAKAPNVLKGGVRPPNVAPVSSSALNKPKKAPLMQKALQFMRGRKR